MRRLLTNPIVESIAELADGGNPMQRPPDRGKLFTIIGFLAAISIAIALALMVATACGEPVLPTSDHRLGAKNLDLRARDRAPQTRVVNRRVSDRSPLRPVADDREGGETIADAFPITSLSYTDTGATCDNDYDYNIGCDNTNSSGPGAVSSLFVTEDAGLASIFAAPTTIPRSTCSTKTRAS